MRDPSQDGQPFAAPSRITVVSGLPRSGTSLVMQVLESAGLPIARDDARAPDADNPRGYLELEAVKRIRIDVRFLEACGGRVVKIVAPLLTELPPDHAYRVLFVERDLGEILASQRAMLEREGRVASPGASDEALALAFRRALDSCRGWLARSPEIPTLFIDHRALLESTEEAVSRIARFLEQTSEGARPADLAAAARARAAMIRAVEPSLYRSRGGR